MQLFFPHSSASFFQFLLAGFGTAKDYKKILAEVNEEYENIIFRYLATTFQQLQARGKVNSDEIWIQRFEDIVDRYIKAVALIVHKPHFKSQEYTAWQHADRVKRWTPQMCEEYKEVEALGKDKLERHFFAYKEQETTINTLENRFVKYTIEKIGARLETVLVKIINNPSRKDPAQNNNEQLSDSKKQKLREYLQRLRQLRSHAFFKTVGRFEGLKQESLVLQNRTGYVQIYKSWILLKRGIDLYNGVANIGTLQIWEIYE